MITDILSMDDKVALSSKSRRDKDFTKDFHTLHIYSNELGITLVSQPIDSLSLVIHIDH